MTGIRYETIRSVPRYTLATHSSNVWTETFHPAIKRATPELMISKYKTFALFIAANVVLCTLVFLFVCDFFTSYSATAVSTGRYDVASAKSVPVFLATADGEIFQRNWRLKLIQDADLPVRPNPPASATPEEGYTVRKDQFALYYRIVAPDSSVTVVPTTTPSALAVSVLCGLIMLFLRNMYVAGSPFHIQRRPKKRLRKLAPQGQVASVRKGGRKGPPPRRKQKGRGRRK